MRSLLFVACILSLGACQCGPTDSGGDGGRLDGGSGVAGAGGSAGAGGTAGGGGAGGAGSGGNAGQGGDVDAGRCDEIIATVRDFRDDHPDFERGDGTGLVTGLVQPMLDSEGLPVYAHSGMTAAIESAASFSQWYRDAGVNLAFRMTLPVMHTDAGMVFDDSSFFPLDGMGFGNQGRDHNFHFTTQIVSGFTYRGGERFTFRGDDDVFIFVNNRLALDLGGIHSVEVGTIDFDAQAANLGLTVGQTYPLHVFQAERHTTQSNFRIETSIECFRSIEIQ